ncbi:hypothetical protein DSO57_1012655 [Entomophthora muscae]|uniref:Uncharacterized protein n=1 Tax=Entomophthora muscae TaxID=34485 RepID=A0ACC2RX02_9FUNG|nr:hypothetical protein DSO57_1012655 [Entomophthora muscae]
MSSNRVSPFIRLLFEYKIYIIVELILYSIISDEINQSYISWAEDGQSFIIHNIGAFQASILLPHFKHQNTNSFFSPLYEFKRTSDGRKIRGKGLEAYCSFKHEHFVRGRPQFLCYIRRSNARRYYKKVKKSHDDVLFERYIYSSAMPDPTSSPHPKLSPLPAALGYSDTFFSKPTTSNSALQIRTIESLFDSIFPPASDA